MMFFESLLTALAAIILTLIYGAIAFIVSGTYSAKTANTIYSSKTAAVLVGLLWPVTATASIIGLIIVLMTNIIKVEIIEKYVS